MEPLFGLGFLCIASRLLKSYNKHSSFPELKNNYFDTKMKKIFNLRIAQKINKMKIKYLVCVSALFLVFILPAAVYAAGVEIPSGTGLSEGSDLKTVVENFMKWFLSIFGFLAIISFLISAFMYFMGGSMTGEKKDVSGAKKQMQWSIVGVIVGLGGYVILQAIESLMKGNSNF